MNTHTHILSLSILCNIFSFSRVKIIKNTLGAQRPVRITLSVRPFARTYSVRLSDMTISLLNTHRSSEHLIIYEYIASDEMYEVIPFLEFSIKKGLGNWEQ